MSELPPFPINRFLAPRYWLTWLWLGLVRMSVLLPYALQMWIGRRIGNLLRLLAPYRRRVAEINIGECFPELARDERRQLVRRHFESLGMGIMETALCWWGTEQRLRPLITIEGLEHLQAALRRGKGVILLSAHFTDLELGGRLLALFTPFHVMYRKHKNPLFEEVMRRRRMAHFETAIPRKDTRAILNSLKANMPVWYAPDQDYGRKHSVFVPFFGVPAATITATSRFASISGAAVVPFFPRRLDRQRGYQLTILPALEDFPGGDHHEDALRINRLIEEEVRKSPEQYIWVHRRFKTRPEGLPRLYERKARADR